MPDPSPSTMSTSEPTSDASAVASASASGSAAESAATPKATPEEKAREVLESHSIRVFRPCTTRFDPRRVDFPEDFFEPSTSELMAASRSLASGVQRMADAPLMTKKMRDVETARRMSRFRKVLIRLLFPDRIAIQGIFTPQSTVRNVQRFIRAALLDARNVKFHMFVVPPKMKLVDLDATLWSQGLVPAALVHVGIDEGPADSRLLLKQWLVDRIEDTPESIEPLPIQMPSILPEEKPSSSTSDAKKSSVKKKIPKWFKSK